MHNLIRSDLPETRQAACKFLLALCWCGGLILGISFASSADDSTLLMMHSASMSAVSIPGLLSILFLPFLLSALAVYLSRSLLLLGVAFVKAFAFGFCAFAVNAAFQSAGWLVCMLLMFSDLCSLPLLVWFWLRHIAGDRRNAAADLAVCAAIALFIGGFDYCVVSPALAMLL